jgi:hypothetical protein
LGRWTAAATLGLLAPVAGRAHAEILRLTRLLGGLHAILRPHFAQEEEAYLSLLDEPGRLPAREIGPTGPGRAGRWSLGAPARRA